MHIKKLHLYSSDLKKQRKFYEELLGFSIEESAENYFDVKIGHSKIRFEYSSGAKPYHIAFHISAEKEQKALAWLKKRVDILTLGGQEIIDFSSWNAKSIYFYDTDQNVIEFIARRHLHKSPQTDFSTQDICGIAEIGLVTQDVKSVYQQIHKESGLEQYSGDLEKFCPIGDDHGLLITIDNRQKKTWFPTDDKAQNVAFNLKFSHNNQGHELLFDGKNLRFLE